MSAGFSVATHFVPSARSKVHQPETVFVPKATSAFVAYHCTPSVSPSASITANVVYCATSGWIGTGCSACSSLNEVMAIASPS